MKIRMFIRQKERRTIELPYSCSNCEVYVVHVHDCAVPSPYMLHCRMCAVTTACENLEFVTTPSVHAFGWGTRTVSVSTAHDLWHSTVDLRAVQKNKQAATPANVAKGLVLEEGSWRKESTVSAKGNFEHSTV